ncbi:MAG TPA: YfhO family protein [Acidimicrobiales bacterium]|nr:YfhO family protein [Acidimicrobiales bacterium]
MIALSFLAVAWVVFVYPIFYGQVRFPVDFATPTARLANPELGDAFFAEYPWHTYLGERLSEGEVPLWDPHRLAGTPFASSSVTAVWYPPNWLYATGHTLAVFTVISVLSLLGALLLSYWFLRVMRLHPYAASLGAVGFAFSAFVLKWSAHDSIIGSVMWLPLALGGVQLAFHGRLRRGTTLAALALALSVLAGHAQMTMYVWAATGAWAVVALTATALAKGDAGARRRTVIRGVTATVAIFGLGAGLAAVQLVPLAQLSEFITRQEVSYLEVQVGSLPAAHLATLVLPDYFGSALDHNYNGLAINYIETALYAGLLTIPLAALALFRRWSSPLVLFLLVVGVVGFATALNVGSVGRIVYSLPLLSQTRFPTRSIFYIDLALTGLAAVGLDSLIRHRSGADVAVVATVTLGLAAATVWLSARRPPEIPGSYLVPRGLRALAILAAGLVVVVLAWRLRRTVTLAVIGLLVVVTADLWLHGHRWHPFHAARPVVPVWSDVGHLQSVPGPRPRFANTGTYWVFPNFALNYGLFSIEGYDPYILSRFVDLVSLAEDQQKKARLLNFVGYFQPQAFRSPIMDLLGVRSVVGGGDALPGPPAFVGRAAVFERPSAFPAAFLATCAEPVRESQTLARLREMSAGELRSTAVVSPSASPGAVPPPSPGSCRPGPEVTIERYAPERVVVTTPAAGPTVLVLTDAWFPGWHVRVDGRARPLLRVDHALRGVALPEGSHRVEFFYRPGAVVVGAGVTALSAIVLVGIWLVPELRRQLRARRPTPLSGPPPR